MRLAHSTDKTGRVVLVDNAFYLVKAKYPSSSWGGWTAYSQCGEALCSWGTGSDAEQTELARDGWLFFLSERPSLTMRYAVNSRHVGSFFIERSEAVQVLDHYVQVPANRFNAVGGRIVANEPVYRTQSAAKTLTHFYGPETLRGGLVTKAGKRPGAVPLFVLEAELEVDGEVVDDEKQVKGSSSAGANSLIAM